MRYHGRCFVVALCLMAFWFVQAGAENRQAPSRTANSGRLEIDCNFARVDLYLCPQQHFETKKSRRFFGLISSEKHSCSGGKMALGSTPVEPVDVPAGTYVLMIPADYTWEHEGIIKIEVEPGKRTYFLLKLFSNKTDRSEEDYGGGGGGGGGGAGAR